MRITSLAFAGALAALPCAADAHGDAPRGPATPQPMVETDFGRTGDPRKVVRTVRVEMSDRMRFHPDAIQVKQGDTVRFLAKNSGMTMHEMVFGTLQALKDHAELMKKHPGMEHDEPYMAHVEPGKTAEIVWQFTKAGEYYYGCLIPGHFEAGMVGRVKVIAK